MSAAINFPFLRRIEVEFEGLEGIGSRTFISTGKVSSDRPDNIRLTADINKSIIGIPGQSTITIFNLAPETRAAFVRNQTKVRVKAGWDNGPFKGISQCFYGNLLNSISARRNADIVTTISSISAFDSLSVGQLNETYNEGTPVRYIIDDIYNRIEGLDGNLVRGIDQFRVGSGGLSFRDGCKTCLDKLGKSFGFSWSISDNILYVISDTQTLGESTTVQDPYLIEATPILSSALQYTVGVQWVCTFNPSIRAGYSTTVKSMLNQRQDINGTYRVNTVNHSLDCFSPNSFTTTATAHILGRQR